MFPTAESLNAAMTEEANVLTRMVSLLLFRLISHHREPTSNPAQSTPPWTSSCLSQAAQLLASGDTEALSATPADLPKAQMGKDLITLLFPAL